MLFSGISRSRLGLLLNRLGWELLVLSCCDLLDCGDVSVELAATHHGEENVEASACECDDCGVVSFAFTALSFIELP